MLAPSGRFADGTAKQFFKRCSAPLFFGAAHRIPSQVGQGTKVTVSLPRTMEQQAAYAVPRVAE